mmetsp:Transcript_17491/g.22106  ORF Transcript_17491/g.22106 Transcript_17491/m.22106 type:complete len:89 (-) Transcript_17491:261-527(-)
MIHVPIHVHFIQRPRINSSCIIQLLHPSLNLLLRQCPLTTRSSSPSSAVDSTLRVGNFSMDGAADGAVEGNSLSHSPHNRGQFLLTAG